MESSYTAIEDDVYMCRICYEEVDLDNQDKDNMLISPCRCNGNSKYVHRQCLELWRNSNPENPIIKKQCMECNYIYRFNNNKHDTLKQILRYLSYYSIPIVLFYIISLILLNHYLCYKVSSKIKYFNKEVDSCTRFLSGTYNFILFLFYSSIAVFLPLRCIKRFSLLFESLLFLLVVNIISYYYNHFTLVLAFGYLIYQITLYCSFIDDYINLEEDDSDEIILNYDINADAEC